MNPPFFGHHLVERGLVTLEQLLAALDRQRAQRMTIGKIARKHGLLSQPQVYQVLNARTKHQKPFGAIAVELGLLTHADVSKLMKLQAIQVPIGELLVDMDAIDRDVLEQELAAYRKLRPDAPLPTGHPFAMNAVETDDGLEITLRGILDDRTKIDADSLPTGLSVMIDASGVESINSAGVRTWVSLLREICEKAPAVTIHQLPPVLVRQAGMIANFLGRARVASFFTPWACTECGHEALKLHHPNEKIPETYPCPECSGEMEFDDILESYLAYLST